MPPKALRIVFVRAPRSQRIVLTFVRLWGLQRQNRRRFASLNVTLKKSDIRRGAYDEIQRHHIFGKIDDINTPRVNPKLPA